MNGNRLARNVSAAAVAGIAAWSSWSHMVHVALHYGERPEVAYVLPLSVDGMLVVATVAMADDKRTGRAVRLSARVAFLAGVVASVAANIAAAHPSVGARIVAGWPALALLLVVEMLSRSGLPVPAGGEDTAALTLKHQDAAAPDTLPTEPTRPAAPGKPDSAPDSPPTGAPTKRTRKATAAESVAEAHAKWPTLTHAELAEKAGVSLRSVARHRPGSARAAGRVPDLLEVGAQ